jgi:hypothetical protein
MDEPVAVPGLKGKLQCSLTQRISPRNLAKGGWILLVLLLAFFSQRSWGQAIYAGTYPPSLGFFVIAGASHTQFAHFTDNSAGGNFGIFFQRSPLLGAEIRVGSYPVSARATQSPLTGGIRMGMTSRRAHVLPYGFLGGGVQKGSDLTLNHSPTYSHWSPCWQASAGVDIPMGNFAWRIAEVTWLESYASTGNSIRSWNLNTGIVFHPRRGDRH